jgi:hypothetical protein
MRYIILITIAIIGCTRNVDNIAGYEAVIGIQMSPIPKFYVSKYQINPLSSVFIKSVAEGSPAEECGIHSGDIIYAIDGENVASMTEFRNTLKGKNIVIMHVWRKGDVMTVECHPKPTTTPLSPIDELRENEFRKSSYETYFDRNSLRILSVK